MTEKQFQSIFCKWLRNQRKQKIFNYTFAFELKVAKKKLYWKSALQPQQIPELVRAKKSCVYHKISDQSMGLKPFDGFQICNAKAYLIILWGKTMYWLDPEWVENDMKNTKGIDEERAEFAAEYIIKLSKIYV